MINLYGFLYQPFVVTKANKDKPVTIKTHAKKCIEWLSILGSNIIESVFDLLQDLLAAGRITSMANTITGAFGILVLDYDPVINRVYFSANNRKFVCSL